MTTAGRFAKYWILAEDVQSLAEAYDLPKLTEAEATDLLRRIEDRLVEAMHDAAHAVIYDALLEKPGEGGRP